MNREEYNSCVARGMSGKHLTGDERKLEFCTVAKLCSGKSKSREEAVRMCKEPKPDKPLDGRRRRRRRTTEDVSAKDIKRISTCVLKNLEPDRVPQEIEIANALSDCL